MINKGLCILIVLIITFYSGFSNINDDVLVSINGKTIAKSEFISVYEKNNLYNQVVDSKSIDEYLELYINFFLKVNEAINQGYDTTQAFINELNTYREQLAQPYLNDKKVTEKLIEEAYERMKYDIRASHILISLSQHALTEDTITAYNKINDLREKAISGEDFNSLAESSSDDPSAKDSQANANRPAMPGNKGDLGYFTAFNMPYPFETVAYNTPVGEISEIIRTSYGYHIIKVVDKIPAMGQIRASHIMTAVQNDDEDENKKAENKINEIYQKLLDGEDFIYLVKEFSDDKGSAARNGEIPPFTSSRMLPEVIKALSEIEEGDVYTKPVKTSFGWHIFKLHNKTGIGNFEDSYPELKTRVSRDQRSIISQSFIIEKLKNEYSFEENIENIDVFYEIVDNNIFQGRWDYDNLKSLDNQLFSFADKQYTQKDFANYLKENQVIRSPEDINSFVIGRYYDFVNNAVISYENSILEKKHPEFKQIMKEYHDGILLFEITDKVVWSKAMKDTAGLSEYFEKNKENYKWGKRIDATLYICKDKGVANNLRKELRRANRKGKTIEDLLAKFNTDNNISITASDGIFEEHDHPVLNKFQWDKGISDIIDHDDASFVLNIKELLEPEHKKLSEIRGLVIADYQNFLENEWVNELKKKYEIIINNDVLESIKERY